MDKSGFDKLMGGDGIYTFTECWRWSGENPKAESMVFGTKKEALDEMFIILKEDIVCSSVLDDTEGLDERDEIMKIIKVLENNGKIRWVTEDSLIFTPYGDDSDYFSYKVSTVYEK